MSKKNGVLIFKCSHKGCNNILSSDKYDLNEYVYKLFNPKTRKWEFFCCRSHYEEAARKKQMEQIPKSMRSKFLMNDAVMIKKGKTPFQIDFGGMVGRVFDISKASSGKFEYAVNFQGRIIPGVPENMLQKK